MPGRVRSCYEELNAEGEGLLPTHHHKIKVFSSEIMPWSEIETQLLKLRRRCVSRSGDEVVMQLRNVVPDYAPAGELTRRAAMSGV